MILAFPLMVLLVFPGAASFEVSNIRLTVVDQDKSPNSRRLVDKAVSSGFFLLSRMSADYAQALDMVERDRADMILEIPRHFERDLVREQRASVRLSANGVNAVKAGVGSAYLTSILADYSRDFSHYGTSLAHVEVVPRFRFNPTLNYIVFMVPALMVMVLTMLCGFLPALNIVGEKEAGTMEQMNVTPVPRFLFIFSKLLPYWLMGFVVLTLCFGAAWLFYGLLPVGNLGVIYLFAALYVLTISGFGLVISNHSRTVQQAMFVMYFVVILLIIMSGLFTPVQSMPPWARALTMLNPLKYLMEVMRMVYLRGSGVADMVTHLTALAGFALFFNTWAVLSYRKTG